MTKNGSTVGTDLARNSIGAVFAGANDVVCTHAETPNVLAEIDKEFRQGKSGILSGFDIVSMHYSGLKFYGGIVTTGVVAIGSSIAWVVNGPSTAGSFVELLLYGGPLIVSVFGSMFLLPFFASGLAKKFDKIRLKKHMKSKKSKDRVYYVNRMLIDIIFAKSKTASIFDDTYTLAYALWVHELFHETQPQVSNKLSRKFLEEANFEMFKLDKHFSVYLDVAEEMNSGILRRGSLPLIERNAMDRKIIRKAKVIITSRKQNVIKYANRFEEDARLAIEMLGNGLTQEDVDLKKSHTSYSNDLSTLKEIESEWFDTQNDIVQLLKFPMFADIREPLVQSFHTKLSVAKSLAERVLNNDFVIAISDLKVAWSLLSHEAQRIELSKFDDGERKKILMATNLMSIALDIASTPAERQSAYKKAMEQLKGLIVLPRSVISTIEQAVSRQEIAA